MARRKSPSPAHRYNLSVNGSEMRSALGTLAGLIQHLVAEARAKQLSRARPAFRWMLRARYHLHDWSWSGWRLDLRYRWRDWRALRTHRRK